MQLGTAAVLTILMGLCTACLITNCPKGGKRAGPHSQEPHAIRQVFAVIESSTFFLFTLYYLHFYS
jgi:hypothetical protein